METEMKLDIRSTLIAAGLTAGIAALLAPASLAETRAPEGPRYGFRVEIDGVEAGHFTGVDGLSIEMEVVEYQDGDDYVIRKRPGRAKFGDITLAREFAGSDALSDWALASQQGSPEIRSVSIILCDNNSPHGSPAIRTWHLPATWPSAWKVHGFDGKGNDVVTEEITFVVEDLHVY